MCRGPLRRLGVGDDVCGRGCGAGWLVPDDWVRSNRTQGSSGRNGTMSLCPTHPLIRRRTPKGWASRSRSARRGRTSSRTCSSGKISAGWLLTVTQGPCSAYQLVPSPRHCLHAVLSCVAECARAKLEQTAPTPAPHAAHAIAALSTRACHVLAQGVTFTICKSSGKDSRRRDCHFDDTPFLSRLKHLIKVGGGAAE